MVVAGEWAHFAQYFIYLIKKGVGGPGKCIYIYNSESRHLVVARLMH